MTETARGSGRTLSSSRIPSLAILALAILAPALSSCTLSPRQIADDRLALAFNVEGAVIVNLSDLELREVPDTLMARDRSRVTALLLRDCAISALPDGFFSGLPALRELVLAGNGLTSLPGGLETCVELRSVDLSDNPLGALPAGLVGLPRLTTLFAARVGVKGDDPSLPELSRIEFLDLSGNPLAGAASLPAFERLYFLDLSETGLREVPMEKIAACPLVELALARNGLATVPPLAFPALARLDLSDNALAECPDLSRCVALRDLDLSGNPLATIDPARLPPSLERLALARVPGAEALVAALRAFRPELEIVLD